MRLTRNQLDALHRVALAAFYTSPSTRSHIATKRYDVAATLQQLADRGLIRHDGRWLLTDSGSTALDAQLSGDHAAQLVRLRARRAARPT